MSTRQKGNDAELLACRLLTGQGYLVWRPSQARYAKPYSGADVFGVFDLIACKPGSPTRWIQVKSEAAFRRKVEAAIRAVPVQGVKEYWLLLPGGQWKTKEIP